MGYRVSNGNVLGTLKRAIGAATELTGRIIARRRTSSGRHGRRSSARSPLELGLPVLQLIERVFEVRYRRVGFPNLELERAPHVLVARSVHHALRSLDDSLLRLHALDDILDLEVDFGLGGLGGSVGCHRRSGRREGRARGYASTAQRLVTIRALCG